MSIQNYPSLIPSVVLGHIIFYVKLIATNDAEMSPELSTV
jgi:hypothetical protein